MLVSSCVVAEVPVVDRLEENPYTVLKDGDRVVVDADAETVLIEAR